MSYRLTPFSIRVSQHPTEARAELVAALEASGQRLHVVAKALGVGKDTIRRTCKRLGVPLVVRKGRASHGSKLTGQGQT